MSSRSRCGKCCQLGHTRRSCPHNDSDASAMVDSYKNAKSFVKNINRNRIQILRQEMIIQLLSIQTIEEARDYNDNIVFVPSRPFLNLQAKHDNTPTRPTSLIKIQEILFDNSEELSDGLYKQLMDALIIKD